MPKNLLDQFKDLVKGPLVEPSAYADRLLNLEPGIVYRKDEADFNATLRFTINYNQTVEVPFYEVQRSLRGLDPNGAVVVDPDYNELQIFGTPADGDAVVLGKAFLSQVGAPSPWKWFTLLWPTNGCRSYISTSITRACRSIWHPRKQRRQLHSHKPQKTTAPRHRRLA
jgi:hypothetical protein